MNLTAGTKLDRYEISGLVGKGAMGEVYRARDERIGRDVAIKVLPAAFARDEERLRRFDQEARAAGALNHANVLAIYDVGTHEGAPFVVSELLQGESLRARLVHGALPPRKAVEYAAQVARGLAAAHAKGIVHRDLKPENLFVSGDGQVKILDFGLAKLTRSESGGATPQDSLLPTMTEYGRVMGTVGYMAPEQVRGEPVDHRADLFSLGCVLHEMLTGTPPFKRGSAADTMAAIVRDDPPELPAEIRTAAPALVAILRRCTEKSAGERFESARDLAFALEVMGTLEAGASRATAAADVTFRRVTFRRGFVPNARFTADGHSVIYSASWEGKPREMFWTHIGNPEARALGLRDADLLAVSSTSELAVLMRAQWLTAFRCSGTLARVPPMGGTARELLHGVYEADWSPDGHQLAIVRSKDGLSRLEFPSGNLLFQTGGWFSQVRVAPDGQRVAFIHHPDAGSDGGAICLVDRKGEMRSLSEYWGTARGLAWSADGSEVWFTADREGAARGLYAVSLEGGLRRVLQLASNLTLHDIAKNGHVLVAHGAERAGISGLRQGDKLETDLSWLDWSLVQGFSADGRTLLFDESAEGGGSSGSVYLRTTDGAPAMRLGDGLARALSPDASWVLASQIAPGTTRGLHVLPTGVGEPRHIPLEDRAVQIAAWLPDSRHIVAGASEQGGGVRLFLVDTMTGEHLAISPEGLSFFDMPLLPRGDHVLAHHSEQGFQLYPLRGGEPQPVPFLTEMDRAVQWAKDGNALYVHRPGELPARIYRLDLTTGERTVLHELTPPDPTGIYRTARVHMSEDAQSYIYTYNMQLLDLHVIEGLR